MKTLLYPGTFDPITNGHIDLAKRALRLFDRVVICVAFAHHKTPLFDHKTRVDLVREAFCDESRLQVVGFDGLLIDLVQAQKAVAVLRGLRAVSDFEYEFALASLNRSLDTRFEALFLTPAQEYAFVSSTLVKEAAKLGADVSNFVPRHVCAAFKERFGG